jgi:hypothetical protein
VFEIFGAHMVEQKEMAQGRMGEAGEGRVVY